MLNRSTRPLWPLAMAVLAVAVLPSGASAATPTLLTAPTLGYFTPGGAPAFFINTGDTWVSPGAWTGSPVSYTYQWLLDNRPIAGAPSTSAFRPRREHAGCLRLRVQAVSAQGEVSLPAQSNVVCLESDVSGPTSTATPGVSGGHQVGDTLTSTAGGWDWGCHPSVADCDLASLFSTSTTYWERSSDGGDSWTMITSDDDPEAPVVTASSYALRARDVGDLVRSRVEYSLIERRATGTMRIGVSDASSVPVGPVLAAGAQGTRGARVNDVSTFAVDDATGERFDTPPSWSTGSAGGLSAEITPTVRCESASPCDLIVRLTAPRSSTTLASTRVEVAAGGTRQVPLVVTGEEMAALDAAGSLGVLRLRTVDGTWAGARRFSYR